MVVHNSLLATWAASGFLVAALVPQAAVAQSAAEEVSPETPAASAEETMAPTAPSPPGREWYGTPIVVADLAAVTLLLLASQANGGEMSLESALAGVGVYTLGGPIVHFGEGRTAAGFGSLGLRVGAPLLGTFMGAGGGSAAADQCKDDDCRMNSLAWGLLIGFVSGAVVASAVDYADLAYKPARASKLAFSVTPTYKPNIGEAGVAVSGRW